MSWYTYRRSKEQDMYQHYDTESIRLRYMLAGKLKVYYTLRARFARLGA